MERDRAIVVPKGRFTPYNAQCVVNLHVAFWSLLLPVSVNGRVSDIWRSYISQKLLWDVDEVTLEATASSRRRVNKIGTSQRSPALLQERAEAAFIESFQSSHPGQV